MDLTEYLKENLKPIEFEEGMANFYIYYDVGYDEFRSDWDSTEKIIGAIYFQEQNLDNVLETLNEENITEKELQKAFKELGWL